MYALENKIFIIGPKKYLEDKKKKKKKSHKPIRADPRVSPVSPGMGDQPLGQGNPTPQGKQQGKKNYIIHKKK